VVAFTGRVCLSDTEQDSRPERVGVGVAQQEAEAADDAGDTQMVVVERREPVRRTRVERQHPLGRRA
jgi:hypothetical protein